MAVLVPAHLALGAGFHWSAAGSWLGAGSTTSGAVVAELGAQWRAQPWVDHSFFVGPRLGVLGGKDLGSSGFLSISPGVEAQLWLVNAIGPGLALDWIVPVLGSPEVAGSGLNRFRVDTFVGIRFKRWGEVGAWGVRAGPFWDTQWGPGVKIGLSLELGGVAGG